MLLLQVVGCCTSVDICSVADWGRAFHSQSAQSATSGRRIQQPESPFVQHRAGIDRISRSATRRALSTFVRATRSSAGCREHRYASATTCTGARTSSVYFPGGAVGPDGRAVEGGDSKVLIVRENFLRLCKFLYWWVEHLLSRRRACSQCRSCKSSVRAKVLLQTRRYWEAIQF